MDNNVKVSSASVPPPLASQPESSLKAIRPKLMTYVTPGTPSAQIVPS
jgi:hypothetical protein